MNLKEKVKSGRWTIDEAMDWLKKREKEGAYVNPNIVAWLNRRRNATSNRA